MGPSATLAPAALARLKSASQSSTYIQSDAGEPPSALGPLAPIASWSMIGESPMRTSACRIFPSGPTAREISSAPSAFLYHAIDCTALSSESVGVTV